MEWPGTERGAWSQADVLAVRDLLSEPATTSLVTGPLQGL